MGISGVFVEGQEVVGMEEGSGKFRDGASVDEGKYIDEGGEVGAFWRKRAIGGMLVRQVSGKGIKKINGVSEGAGSSATTGMGKGTEDKGGFEGEVEVLTWEDEHVLWAGGEEVEEEKRCSG